MKNQKETIRKFVGYLNNPEKDGGFWLPNIQRPFIWKKEQIEKLYDSILREYPIGSLLIWKTKSNIKRRKFIDNYKDSIKISDFNCPPDDSIKMLVLDGQQRLQSLFIGLKGGYNSEELYINILSGDLKHPEDIKFDFNFLDLKQVQFPWVKFKDLIFNDNKIKFIKNKILKNINEEITEDEDDRIDENLELIRNVFCTQENIIYQEIDSIDRPETYSEDDIVEVFIRANSGGTQLSKSDLLFSLLSVSWEDADEKLIELLEKLNKTGYDFNRDFILKTCLVLLDKGANYKVEKFRDENTRNKIIEMWEKISNSIKAIKDFIYDKTLLKTDKNLPSYLSLIPLIYFNYHYTKKWLDFLPDYQQYLLRTSLTGVFGGSPDNLLDKIIKKINEIKNFSISDIFDVIKDDGRSLEVSKETILGLNYWKKEIHLFFNIWYGFNYQPALDANAPQIDHIFPQTLLKSIKIPNEFGQYRNLKYKWQDRDQIANLMLLTAKENGASEKTAIPPEKWFNDKSSEYLDLHLIPKDKKLWKLENFEDFIKERKNLILKHFNYLLYKE